MLFLETNGKKVMVFTFVAIALIIGLSFVRFFPTNLNSEDFQLVEQISSFGHFFAEQEGNNFKFTAERLSETANRPIIPMKAEIKNVDIGFVNQGQPPRISVKPEEKMSFFEFIFEKQQKHFYLSLPENNAQIKLQNCGITRLNCPH